jgi:hypothetical protein
MMFESLLFSAFLAQSEDGQMVMRNCKVGHSNFRLRTARDSFNTATVLTDQMIVMGVA